MIARRGDSGPSPKTITSGTYLQHVALAEQFLEGDITSCGRVRLVWSCDGDKPGLYLGEQRLFEGGEGGRQQDASSQLCTWSSLDISDIISSLLGHEVLLQPLVWSRQDAQAQQPALALFPSSCRAASFSLCLRACPGDHRATSALQLPTTTPNSSSQLSQVRAGSLTKDKACCSLS